MPDCYSSTFEDPCQPTEMCPCYLGGWSPVKSPCFLWLQAIAIPALEVPLLQALKIHNMVQVQLSTMLGKNMIASISDLLSTPLDVTKFVKSLQIPGVGKENGMSVCSFRRHVMVKMAISAVAIIFT